MISLRMISFKRSIIAAHIVGWLIFLSLPFIFLAGESGISAFFSGYWQWLFLLIYTGIFYLHTYMLFPVFYLRKKYALYAASVILLLALIFFIRPFDRMAMINGPAMPSRAMMDVPPGPPPGEMHRPPPLRENLPHVNGRERPRLDIISIALFILIIALSIAIVMAKRWRQAVEQAAKAQADKANAELSFLKAQINPHFLFNTLNNIYSQAIMKDDRTAESIMMLSNIMRYVTDEATEDFVPLESEINCTRDFIELQRLRMSSKTVLDFSVAGNLENKSIAPMLFMTFVENVFKHGTSNNEVLNISIRITAEEFSIHLFCENKIFPRQSSERTGTGITNTKKRLEHLYPGKHVLDINKENGFFTVNLILQS